jgi:hypothetical protein
MKYARILISYGGVSALYVRRNRSIFRTETAQRYLTELPSLFAPRLVPKGPVCSFHVEINKQGDPFFISYSMKWDSEYYLNDFIFDLAAGGYHYVSGVH